MIKAEWLHPELHITAMGSDQAGKNEIDPQALVQADLYVADRAPQAQSWANCAPRLNWALGRG